MVANFSSPIEIFFECKNTSAEIWADNVSLQPFTKKQWRSHQDQSISKAQYLEEILREGYSHPAVQGIIMFAGPELAGFNVTTLADINFENTPAGYVVDELIQEWNSGTLETRTDNKGFIDLSLFHGDYGVTVKHPLTNSSATMSLRVTKDKPQSNIHVLIDT
ncbi:hypothetical protein L484_005052 [Morus notabilis]|uniref:Uncharacterized protein n=1 Tax=Morus notabilis TaxID=981085 RepID=W9R8U8_9ROSA|nr:hypothetical protein L484_005052 [Morus notabilis]